MNEAWGLPAGHDKHPAIASTGFIDPSDYGFAPVAPAATNCGSRCWRALGWRENEPALRDACRRLRNWIGSVWLDSATRG
jgi:hypothetical protein